MTDYQTEFRLLLRCARTELSAEARTQAEELAALVDWGAFVDLARLHQVMAIAYWGLNQVEAEAVPQKVRDRLHSFFHRSAAFNLSFSSEIGRLQAIFTEHGVRFLPFKGPLLAQLAYRSLGLRPCTDVDILIPKQSYEQVESLLAEHGYHLAGHIGALSGYRKSIYLYLSQQASFVRNRQVALDLHISLMPPGYYFEPDFDTLYERSVELRVGNVDVRTFEPEDLLLILSFHGVKNRWEALKHYCDVAELIRSHPQLDWEAAIERARQTRAERILRLGVYQAYRLLEAPLPAPVVAWCTEDTGVEALGRELEESIRHSHLQRLNPRERFRFHLSVQDTLATKVRYCLYALARRMNAGLMAEEAGQAQ